MRKIDHWLACGSGMIGLLATVSVASAQNIGPVLHYSLNDGTRASVASDTSGNGLDGTLTNMDPGADWVAGIEGSGLDFDGSDDFVEVDDDPLLDFGAGDFSVSLWVFKRATSEGVCDNVYGASKWSTGASPGSNEWALQVGNCPASGPRTDQAGFSVESGTARYVVRDPNKLTLNQWHHIVGVREGESLRLYVDGVFAAEDRSQPCNSVVNDTGLALRVARNQATSTLPATNAVFDEVHIYPFALDDGDVTVAQPAAGEIATIFQSPTVVVTRPTPSTTTTLVPCPAICGDATMDGQITATDALATLASAVGQRTCEPCICDVNDNGTLTATDALIILKFSVGTVCDLDCPLAG